MLLKPDDVHGGRRGEHSGLRQVLDPQSDDSVAVFVFADIDVAHCRRVDLRRSEVVGFGPACQGSEHQYAKTHERHAWGFLCAHIHLLRQVRHGGTL